MTALHASPSGLSCHTLAGRVLFSEMKIATRTTIRPVLVLFAVIVFFTTGWDANGQSGDWVVKSAPFRAGIRLQESPKYPGAGVAIELPDFGGGRADLADAVLVDSAGATQPVAAVWRGEGQRAILLAKSLEAGKDYAIYFGGQTARQPRTGIPEAGLLLETRRLPANPKIDTWQDMENTWRTASQVDGIGFVGNIYHAGNAFGRSADFAAHYSGWLATPDGGNIVLYTLSSDASFVLVDDKLALDWPGIHSPDANPKTVRSKSVTCSPGFTKIDYYQAKIGDGESAAVLGWQKNGKFEPVPPEAWRHPGTARITGLEDARGWPVPLINVSCLSYIGHGGNWFFDVECSAPADLPSDWTAEWRFEDGTTFTGTKCERVIVGANPQFVTLTLRRGKDATAGVKRLVFPDSPPEASLRNWNDVTRYLGLLDKETQLATPALDAVLALLIEVADDGRIAKFAAAWLRKNHPPGDPLWLPAQMARLRALQQTDPRKALEELRRLDPAARKKHAQAFALYELEVLVCSLRDPAAEDLARRIAFEYPDSELAALAQIRIGDLYRLTGRIKPAVEQYQSVQKSVADETGGRKLPAQDTAFSIAVRELLKTSRRDEAAAKLREWELRHPMAKFDSDFLLLRARMLNAFGRWSEAMVELDSFKKIQPGSPCDIDADFYRADALKAMGKSDEAKAIWSGIVARYPRHELANPSKDKLAKP